MKRKTVYLVTMLLLGMSGLFHNDAAAGFGPKVFSKKGHIYISEDGESKTQLTKNEIDREPVLSPDGSCVVFIRQTKDKKDELWIIELEDGKSELLLKEITYPSKGGPEKKPLYRIVTDGIRFSPDSRTVYFVSRDFETSGGIHAGEIKTKKERYIIDGYGLEVIPDGKYEGHLVFRQHRYFKFGGSYDFWWLYSPEGKEEGALGDAEDYKSLNLDFSEWE